MTGKMTWPGVSTVVMGEVEEETWICIASECDDVTVEEDIGKRIATRRVHFAFKEEAEDWLVVQEAGGWEVAGPITSACQYYGETDSLSNCWVCEARREIAE
jgi:hypothetical protein